MHILTYIWMLFWRIANKCGGGKSHTLKLPQKIKSRHKYNRIRNPMKQTISFKRKNSNAPSTPVPAMLQTYLCHGKWKRENNYCAYNEYQPMSPTTPQTSYHPSQNSNCFYLLVSPQQVPTPHTIATNKVIPSSPPPNQSKCWISNFVRIVSLH